MNAKRQAKVTCAKCGLERKMWEDFNCSLTCPSCGSTFIKFNRVVRIVCNGCGNSRTVVPEEEVIAHHYHKSPHRFCRFFIESVGEEVDDENLIEKEPKRNGVSQLPLQEDVPQNGKFLKVEVESKIGLTERDEFEEVKKNLHELNVKKLKLKLKNRKIPFSKQARKDELVELLSIAVLNENSESEILNENSESKRSLKH